MEVHHVSPWVMLAYAGISALLLLLMARAGTRNMQSVPSGFWQNATEQLTEGFRTFASNILGVAGEKHFPFLGTLFMFILLNNWMGLIPVIGKAATSNLNITISLALVTFGYVQYVGVKENGLKKYLNHFLGGAPIWLSPLMVPLEIIGTLAKPFSLSIRLYGNIFGDETSVAVLTMLAASALPIFLPLPFQFPLLLFGVFAGFVQALVFTTLAAIYISLILPHGESH